MSEQKYEETQLYRIRHSAAHVMAQAVLEFYPEAKYTIGPPVENGFYYDFEFSNPITAEDLEKIEKRMRQIVAGSHKFEKKVVSADEARQVFASQPYKLELIDGLDKGGLDEYGNPLNEKPEISLYQHDKFVDLCRGPHVESTKQINPSAFKLMCVAGAYWRGDEKNKMLTRIYGTAWEKPPSSNIICGSWRKPRSATTASWARNSACSTSPRTSVPACRCSRPRARCCAT